MSRPARAQYIVQSPYQFTAMSAGCLQGTPDQDRPGCPDAVGPSALAHFKGLSEGCDSQMEQGQWPHRRCADVGLDM